VDIRPAAACELPFRLLGFTALGFRLRGGGCSRDAVEDDEIMEQTTLIGNNGHETGELH
jgi:hypothetical protein